MITKHKELDPEDKSESSIALIFNLLENLV